MKNNIQVNIYPQLLPNIELTVSSTTNKYQNRNETTHTYRNVYLCGLEAKLNNYRGELESVSFLYYPNGIDSLTFLELGRLISKWKSKSSQFLYKIIDEDSIEIYLTDGKEMPTVLSSMFTLACSGLENLYSEEYGFTERHYIEFSPKKEEVVK